MKLVYAAPVHYSSFAQRAHHFVAFCNRSGGGRTLWINPYPSRLPRLGDLGRSRGRTYPRTDASVHVLTPPAWCADPLMRPHWLRRMVWRQVLKSVAAFVQGEDWMLAIGRPSLLALQLLKQAEGRPSCYDAMDDFPEFQQGGARALNRQVEAEIAQQVDQVIVSSKALQEKFRRHDLAAELVRNGLAPNPQAVDGTAEGKLVFGYVGTIGSWFDWALLAKMARDLPEAQFDLIGPVMAPPKAPLPANVRLLGECASEEVPSRLGRFTAGLIPFKVNALTEAVDPIKYYEYRAAGLLVVSTRFGEMRQREVDPEVCLVHEDTDFRTLMNRAKTHPSVSSEARERFRLENSWQSRFAQSSFLRSRFNNPDGHKS